MSNEIYDFRYVAFEQRGTGLGKNGYFHVKRTINYQNAPTALKNYLHSKSNGLYIVDIMIPNTNISVLLLSNNI